MSCIMIVSMFVFWHIGWYYLVLFLKWLVLVVCILAGTIWYYSYNCDILDLVNMT
jgi:hypothetical protein